MTNQSNTTATVTRQLVATNLRVKAVSDLFGLHFPMRIEPYVFAVAEELTIDNDGCKQYHGGMWHFYTLSNGGFYMAPDFDGNFFVCCENGFQGAMSADALGIVACLYAFSQLSFSDNAGLAEVCSKHYHLLRDFMFEHAEVACILSAID